MSRMIQVRDVSDSVHGALKARAALEGISLSDYIKKELEHIVERPTLKEWLQRTETLKPLSTKRSGAAVIREIRNER